MGIPKSEGFEIFLDFRRGRVRLVALGLVKPKPNPREAKPSQTKPSNSGRPGRVSPAFFLGTAKPSRPEETPRSLFQGLGPGFLDSNWTHGSRYREQAEGLEQPQKPALTPTSDYPPPPKQPQTRGIFGTAELPKPGELERIAKEMVWGRSTRRS